MNKKRHFLFTLIVTIMCVSMIFLAVACDDPDKTPDAKPTDKTDELFTNGEFTLFSGESYPKAPNDWSKAAGSSSALVGSDNVISGVISTEAKSFKKNQEVYGNISNPVAAGPDDFVLMIYNKQATSLKYSSTGVNLDKSSYYKLTFQVKTILETSESLNNQGAYVYLNNDAYAAFEGINTDSQWQTYEVYIETSEISSSQITLNLSLGNGSDYTKGHAFFDNIKLEKLEDKTFNKANFDEMEPTKTKAKYSMVSGDSEFDYTTGTSTILSPVKYNGMAGKGSGNSAPSSSSYLDRGVYNVDKTESIKATNSTEPIKLTVPSISKGSKVLVINNKQATAYGYRSQTPMRFAANGYYQVSVQVRTAALKTGGATLKITNGKDVDDRSFIINNIDTNNEWKEYSFYVEANKTRNNDLYIEMWLGQGGENDKDTHVQGVAMFDCVKITKIDATQFGAQTENIFHLTSVDTVSIDSQNFESTVYDESIKTAFTTFTAEANKLTINNTVPTSFIASNFVKSADDKLIDKLANPITINPNSYYIISMSILTKKIPEGKGLDINLLSINDEGKDYNEQKVVKASLTGLNSDKLEEKIGDTEYTEIKFYVKGGVLESNNVGLEFVLGKGKGSQSAEHVIGQAEIKDIKTESITASEFNSASSNAVTTTASFSESSTSNGVSGNGTFNLIDTTATKELYKDVKKNETDNYNIFDAQGKLDDVLGVPSNWSISNKETLIKDDISTRSKSGILDLTTAMATKPVNEGGFGIDTATFYNNTHMTLEDNRTVLAFQTSNAAYSYSSNNISLSANKYYVFSVWAKTTGSTILSIELATKTGAGKQNVNFYNENTDNQWKQYTFYVETGASSVNVKLTLSIGNPNESGSDNGSENETGIVYFNDARYQEISEDLFKSVENKLTTNSKVQSWFIDSFDTSSPSSDLSKPEHWEGALVDSKASADKDTHVSGVFDKTSGDWNNIDIDPDANEALYNKIFTNDPDNVIGDSVLAIYNKKPTAYKYTNNISSSLKAESYYRISLYVLTYGLSANDSATITLKLNNQTYSFGKKLGENPTSYDKARQINTSTYDGETETSNGWKKYTYYVHTEKDVTPNVSISVGLGYNEKDNWKKGYVFVDNFALEEIEEKDFIPMLPQESEEKDPTLIAEDKVATNYRIVLEKKTASAEENITEPEDKEPEEAKKTNDLLWLWISSGIVGGVVLLVLIVFLIKKFGKKNKSSKKTFKTKK